MYLAKAQRTIIEKENTEGTILKIKRSSSEVNRLNSSRKSKGAKDHVNFTESFNKSRKRATSKGKHNLKKERKFSAKFTNSTIMIFFLLLLIFLCGTIHNFGVNA